jgi:hypothetical protein
MYIRIETNTVRMEQNVGATDRQIRTAIGAIAGLASLGILAEVISLPEILSPVLGVIALAMLGTAATGTCGLYSLIGVDTCSMKSGTK